MTERYTNAKDAVVKRSIEPLPTVFFMLSNRKRIYCGQRTPRSYSDEPNRENERAPVFRVGMEKAANKIVLVLVCNLAITHEQLRTGNDFDHSRSTI